VLVGSEESRVPSALYSEKAYVLSQGFVRAALTSPPQGLADIVSWLYISRQGPGLLKRIVDDCNSLLPERPTSLGISSTVKSNDDRITSLPKLSAGALILLRKILDWLTQYLDQHPGGDGVSSEPMDVG